MLKAILLPLILLSACATVTKGTTPAAPIQADILVFSVFGQALDSALGCPFNTTTDPADKFRNGLCLTDAQKPLYQNCVTERRIKNEMGPHFVLESCLKLRDSLDLPPETPLVP
jgi:hypothetical protein